MARKTKYAERLFAKIGAVPERCRHVMADELAKHTGDIVAVTRQHLRSAGPEPLQSITTGALDGIHENGDGYTSWLDLKVLYPIELYFIGDPPREAGCAVSGIYTARPFAFVRTFIDSDRYSVAVGDEDVNQHLQTFGLDRDYVEELTVGLYRLRFVNSLVAARSEQGGAHQA